MVNRYDWQDSITRAVAVGVLPAKVLSTSAQLATAIKWNPRGGRRSALYWGNELAADVHGISRATLYRHVKILKQHGYLIVIAGNLAPQLPDNELQILDAFLTRQAELILEGKKSQSDTSKSQSDNPFSVDTFSEHTYI